MTLRSRTALTAICGALLLAGALVAQPTITRIQKNDIARSGRIAITGTGFGAVQGEVLVGGAGSWISDWRDTRIVAYVPEESALGLTSLAVVADGVPSNEIQFNVVDRVSDGRIKWTFETDGDNMWWRPALAPDGTLYVHTNNDWDGLVYAITPDGALKWIQKVNWYPYVPPTAGPDGAAYVGSIGTVYRIGPDGQIDWEYNPDGVNIEVAPTVGPDGRVYGAFEISGAFALEAETGAAVWENPGTPMISDKSGDATEAIFGIPGPGQPVDRFYVSVDGGGGFYAFSLDGEQLFNSSFGNIKGTTEVAVGSDGTIYGPRAIGLLVAAAEPTWGTTLWEYFPHWAVGTDHVEIGTDDTLYFKSNGCSQIEAFDPDSVSQKWITPMTYCYRRPTITPDGEILVTHGTDGLFEPDFVRAFDPQTGAELWTQLLLPEYNEQFRVMGVHHARVTPDSSTAYLSTLSLVWNAPDDDPRALLYAIDLEGSGGPGGIACEDVQRLQARCKPTGQGNALQARVTLTDASHDGESVEISFDGVAQSLTVSGNRAQTSIRGATPGQHTIELTDPAGCLTPKVVTCD